MTGVRKVHRLSSAQIKIFLKLLEEDKIFRKRAHIDSSAHMNEKWTALTKQLNNCGSGPKLSPTQWRKRMMGWKHTLDSKYRRILNGKWKADPVLSSLERKAFYLWCRPTVPEPVITEELMKISSQKYEDQIKFNGIETENISPELEETVPLNTKDIEKENKTAEIRRLTLTQEEVDSFIMNHLDRLKTEPIGFEDIYDGDDECNVMERDDCSVMENENIPLESPTVEVAPIKNSIRIESVVSSYHPQIDNTSIREISEEIARLVDIKEESLKFEIAKFKYRNPGFTYDYAPRNNNEFSDINASCT